MKPKLSRLEKLQVLYIPPRPRRPSAQLAERSIAACRPPCRTPRHEHRMGQPLRGGRGARLSAFVAVNVSYRLAIADGGWNGGSSPVPSRLQPPYENPHSHSPGPRRTLPRAPRADLVLDGAANARLWRSNAPRPLPGGEASIPPPAEVVLPGRLKPRPLPRQQALGQAQLLRSSILSECTRHAKRPSRGRRARDTRRSAVSRTAVPPTPHARHRHRQVRQIRGRVHRALLPPLRRRFAKETVQTCNQIQEFVQVFFSPER